MICFHTLIHPSKIQNCWVHWSQSKGILRREKITIFGAPSTKKVNHNQRTEGKGTVRDRISKIH